MRIFAILAEPSGRGSLARIGLSLGILGLAVLLDRKGGVAIPVSDLRNPLAASNNPVDRLAYLEPDPFAAGLADAGLFGGPALPLILSLHPRPRPEYPAIVLLTFEASLLTFALTSLIKNTASRPRPYVLSPNFPPDRLLARKDRAAFLSGHASMATVGATTFAKLVVSYTGDKATINAAWATAGFLCGATAYLRVKAAKHWPTDAIAGVALGYLMSRTLFAIYPDFGAAAGAKHG